jgi:hypothetical protein
MEAGVIDMSPDMGIAGWWGGWEGGFVEIVDGEAKIGGVER